MDARLLVVDDDRFLLENVARLLQSQGYEVATASSGEEGLRAVERQIPDMAVLDVSLPDFDGITLCRRLRAIHRFPILMLTARSEAMDKVIGLEVGADDYLTKPFDPSELIARVRAHLRRAQEYASAPATSRKRIGGLEIDHDTREALIDGKPIELTKREFELLAHLAANAGRVLTRESLFERNWGFDIEFSSNSLDVHIYRLRKKIEPDPDHPTYIHTVRGYGYRLEAV
ncbi:response regulator transcription factor [Fimbriimonas ginsengisoli]|uniref:Two component transcriptional regulator, winged helix family n=1 Tax=Fimbriimonas ginsengisoli Gsoil 348 TaxID=661478 RepID=A0A068NP68_FIMGI|nr:response regulator transcription factor [Fimbriimonas ginsengisoli]AIE85353.1 two component transcriptional regulator, winged helix family [Fimbriimonas ginsengisoli Gsoil 348]